MAQRHDMPSDVLAAPDRERRSYALGLLLSRLFHPIFMNIGMFLIVGYFAMTTHLQGMLWAVLCIALLIIPPTLFFTMRLRQGVYSDEDISVRHQRTELYLFGLGTVTVSTAILLLLGVPRPFLALLVCAFVMGALATLINLFWKISVHGASVASLATVALLYSRGVGIALWLGALAVGWARVRTGNHTPLQVLAGFVLAATVVVTVFYLVA